MGEGDGDVPVPRAAFVDESGFKLEAAAGAELNANLKGLLKTGSDELADVEVVIASETTDKLNLMEVSVGASAYLERTSSETRTSDGRRRKGITWERGAEAKAEIRIGTMEGSSAETSRGSSTTREREFEGTQLTDTSLSLSFFGSSVKEKTEEIFQEHKLNNPALLELIKSVEEIESIEINGTLSPAAMRNYRNAMAEGKREEADAILETPSNYLLTELELVSGVSEESTEQGLEVKAKLLGFYFGAGYSHEKSEAGKQTARFPLYQSA
jgi:predicted Zn-dependent protease with MMP-like domain